MKLSIIIPCKNEEKYISTLLSSLLEQELPFETEVIISDAFSTDNTIQNVLRYSDRLTIKIINGGLPSVGRNNGAMAATGDILLFIDADSYLKNTKMISNSILKIENGNNLVGAFLNIENNFFVKVLYFFSNIVMMLSKYDKPFVVGSFFMIKRDEFFKHGGFDVELMHCEDYFLSSMVDVKAFSLVNDYVYTDDRRFKKMGRFKIIKYFILNILNRNNKNYFKKDIGYWK
jgi:glycosyltransferase involved in cell wall biosynthesis